MTALKSAAVTPTETMAAIRRVVLEVFISVSFREGFGWHRVVRG